MTNPDPRDVLRRRPPTVHPRSLLTMFDAERVLTFTMVPRQPAHARGDLEFPTLPLLCALRAAGGGQRSGFRPANLPQFAPRPPRHARSDHAIPAPALQYALITRGTTR